ncbi:TetR family transcriptional regulator [Nocardia sp. NBC_00565]|uniref:TetR/AcrR family transcriptional regulator n=1 Tax=Nocardia sp. NBC_00565 TaxID=2975993 RepID=UPI002E80AA41|nr:TetR family transcriptional regulator [Nocardia sp. NBC_00565]WUC04809.1 TetR family transcriptional regulator [Nocardia sp. NBC_00565]
MSNGRPARYARGRERRDELISAAIAVIAERGIERVTFRAVADRAGFPASTTSYFFSSVDEVIDAAITRVAETITGNVADLLETARSGEMTRDELAESLIELVAGQDNDDSVAQFEAYLAVRRRPELAEPVHRIMASIEEAAEKALESFGVADPSIPAKQFLALIDGFTLQEIARPGRPESRRALSDLMTRILDSYAK